MSFLGALAGAGIGGALDAFGANKAEKQRDEMIRRILRQLTGLQGEATVAGGQQLQERRRALKDVRGGFSRALAETANMGVAGATDARDAYVRGTGDDDQALLSRGMYDTQAVESARRGRSSDLTRALAEVRERVAAARAGLLTNQGMAVGAARGDIAGQIGSNFDRRYGIATDMASVRMANAPSYQPQGANIGMLLGSLFPTGGGTSTGGGNSAGLGGLGWAMRR